MNFVYILIYLSLISHTFRFSVVSFLIESLSFAHVSCVKSVPSDVRYQESLQALVCGKNFSNPEHTHLLIASGLIHLFVVSGSHLKILQSILQKILCNKFLPSTRFLQFIIFSLLFFYCAICKFNPPIFRSFVALSLVATTESLHLRFRSENLILISGLICLVLSPEWITSLSLQMSWIAALTLIVINTFFKSRPELFKNSIFYLNYLTTFNFIGLPTPLSIGLSTLLTRFLEYVLFPTALAVYVFPFLGTIFDAMIFTLHKTLSLFNLTVIFRPYEDERLHFFNWILIVALHFFLNRLPTQQSIKPYA